MGMAGPIQSAAKSEMEAELSQEPWITLPKAAADLSQPHREFSGCQALKYILTSSGALEVL